MKKFYIIGILIIISCHVSEIFANTEIKLSEHKERIAIKLFKEIKCPVCDGQSIYDSQTQISVDLRNYIRKKISEDIDPHQIKSSLVEKYGSDILMDSQISIGNIFLWILPFGLLIMVLFIFIRNNNAQ